MLCPECNTQLGAPVGFDINPTETGVMEEDQYICESCKRYVSHCRIMENGTVKETLSAGEVMK